MTQEEKQLLLKDLCARLPYEVKGRVYAETTNGRYDMNGDMVFFNSPFDVVLDDINTSTEEIHVIAIGNEDTIDFLEDQQTCADPYIIDEFEPYLRPMSSMTEEEKEEQSKIVMQSMSCSLDNSESATTMLNDWLLSKHFDVRGLISKGLALEAKEGTYKTE